MIVRDLRKTFRTRLTDAQVPEATILYLMGHAVTVSQGYYELTDPAKAKAVPHLSLEGHDTQAVDNGRGQLEGERNGNRELDSLVAVNAFGKGA